MIYVALLRGINVGGNNRVEMSRLKKLFESLGLQNVSTYINSGNVIFKDGRQASVLEPLIEAAINKEFGLNLRVVLRDLEAIEAACHEIPDEWTNDDKLKTDVMFLWDEINNSDILNKVSVNPAIENALYIEKAGALVWNIGRENVTRGGGIKLIKTDVYPLMTIRNINTTRKLLSLMQQIA